MPFAISNVNLEQTRRNTEYLTGLQNSYVGPLKLAVITHAVDLTDPVFWGPFINNIKNAASSYGNQIKGLPLPPSQSRELSLRGAAEPLDHQDEPAIYAVGSMTRTERQKLATEIVAADPDIIALTGAIDIITDMYDYIIKDCGTSHFFFNIEPPNLPSSTTNYFGYVGQYETDGITGKQLARRLQRDYTKKYAIVLNNEPQPSGQGALSSVPNGPLALRSKGIETEFGSANFVERTPQATLTYNDADPAYVYFTDTSAPPAVNWTNDLNIARGMGYAESEIAVIGVTPVYINYMANHQPASSVKIAYSAFDTLPSSLKGADEMPTD